MKQTCKQNPLLRRIILVQPDQNTFITINDTDVNKGVPKSLYNKLKKLKELNRKIWYEPNFIIIVDDSNKNPVECVNKFFKGRIPLWVGSNTKHKTFRHQRLYLQQEPNTNLYKHVK